MKIEYAAALLMLFTTPAFSELENQQWRGG